MEKTKAKKGSNCSMSLAWRQVVVNLGKLWRQLYLLCKVQALTLPLISCMTLVKPLKSSEHVF